MEAIKGHVYEKDGKRRVVVITGGTAIEPLMEALRFVDDENVEFPTMNGKTSAALGAELADWIDAGPA